MGTTNGVASFKLGNEFINNSHHIFLHYLDMDKLYKISTNIVGTYFKIQSNTTEVFTPNKL